MVFLGSGILAFTLLPDLPDPDPVQYADFTTHLTEVCVIISLMGAGLALDRPFRWRGWTTTWRLLGIVMPLCILVMTLLGLWVLGLGLAAAILVAAAIAPTDPVLASEVQVGKPADTEDDPDEDEVRFALTSEAGLNDGLAFPFVYLAILISHMILAVVTVPLVVRSLFLAYKKRFIEHRKIARVTFPIWLYVSVTGVIVYLMLYQL